MTGLNYTARKIVRMLEGVHGGMVSKQLIEWECWERKGKVSPRYLVDMMAKLRWDHGIPIECCRKGKGPTEGWRIPVRNESVGNESLVETCPKNMSGFGLLIFGLLQKAKGEWVSIESIFQLWDINGVRRPRHIFQPIFRLRCFPGVEIESNMVRICTKGKPRVTAYRLVPQAERLAA